MTPYTDYEMNQERRLTQVEDGLINVKDKLYKFETNHFPHLHAQIAAVDSRMIEETKAIKKRISILFVVIFVIKFLSPEEMESIIKLFHFFG